MDLQLNCYKNSTVPGLLVVLLHHKEYRSGWSQTGNIRHIEVIENNLLYRVIQNDCRSFNNLSYKIHLK